MTVVPVTYIEQKDIIVDFLRHRLEDPRKRAEATYTEKLTWDGSTKEITLTPPSGKVSTITNISLDGTDLKKWRDFYYHVRLEKLIFFETYGSPTGAALVTYKYGSTNWIYSDKPDERLDITSFPRMSVSILSNPNQKLGNYEAPTLSTPLYEIDVITKPKGNDSMFDIVVGWNGPVAVINKMTGEELCGYLANKAVNALSDYESDFHPLNFNLIITNGPRDLPYDVDRQRFRKTVEFSLQTTNYAKINNG